MIGTGSELYSSVVSVHGLNYYQPVGINTIEIQTRRSDNGGTGGGKHMRTRPKPFSDDRDNVAAYATVAVAVWTGLIVTAITWLH